MDVGADPFRFPLADPEKQARPIRHPKTAELHMDSLDRYNVANLPGLAGVASLTNNQTFLKLIGPIVGSSLTNSTNQCILQTKRNLIYGYMSRVALTQFNLNYKLPTIIAGYNDVCAVVVSGTSYLVTIPEGWYNLPTLAAQLQTSLRSVGGGAILPSLTVTAPTNQTTAVPFTTITTGFAVVAGGAATTYFAYSALGSTPAQELQIARFYRLIGMNRAGAGFTPDFIASPMPSPYSSAAVPWATVTLGIPNFLYTDYVDIVSQALTNYKDTKDANSSINSPGSVIGRIWLTEYPLASQAIGDGWPQNGMWGMSPMFFVKNWYNPNWSQWSPNSAINTIDITLLDMFGVPLPWSSTYSTEWSCTLTVTE